MTSEPEEVKNTQAGTFKREDKMLCLTVAGNGKSAAKKTFKKLPTFKFNLISLYYLKSVLLPEAHAASHTFNQTTKQIIQTYITLGITTIQ